MRLLGLVKLGVLSAFLAAGVKVAAVLLIILLIAASLSLAWIAEPKLVKIGELGLSFDLAGD